MFIWSKCSRLDHLWQRNNVGGRETDFDSLIIAQPLLPKLATILKVLQIHHSRRSNLCPVTNFHIGLQTGFGVNRLVLYTNWFKTLLSAVKGSMLFVGFCRLYRLLVRWPKHQEQAIL